MITSVMSEATSSLVKGSKCPTGHFGPISGFADEARQRIERQVFELIDQGTGEYLGEEVRAQFVEPVNMGGTLARLLHRPWSGEWRLRLETETPTGEPPENIGDRVTIRLSDRGAVAIGESCEYVTAKHGGFTTFLTLTLDQDARQRIEQRRAVKVDKGREFAPAVQEWKRGKVKGAPKIIESTYQEQHHATQTATAKGAPFFSVIGESGEQVNGWRHGDERDGGPSTPVELHVSHHCGGVAPEGPYCKVRFEWASSIQREASRFFDALQKMWARGWVPDYARSGTRKTKDGAEFTPIEWNQEGQRLGGPDYGPADRLFYLWVAENPENDQGERNPHIHVLLRWRVPFAFFPCWAKRIERLWGQGFAKLEKLKAAEAAGYYIAKAAGYLSKANGSSDQGPIRGNRYGMAACSRAPGWQPVLVWAWGILGHLMQEAREKWRGIMAPVRKMRDEAKEKLGELAKGDKARHKVARILQGARRRLKELPVFSRFAATFRSQESADKFITWAERQGWAPEKAPPRLWLSTWLQQRDREKKRREWAARFEGFAWHRVCDAAANWFDRWDPVSESCQ